MNVQTCLRWSVLFRPLSLLPGTEDCTQIRMIKNGRTCLMPKLDKDATVTHYNRKERKVMVALCVYCNSYKHVKNTTF